VVRATEPAVVPQRPSEHLALAQRSPRRRPPRSPGLSTIRMDQTVCVDTGPSVHVVGDGKLGQTFLVFEEVAVPGVKAAPLLIDELSAPAKLSAPAEPVVLVAPPNAVSQSLQFLANVAVLPAPSSRGQATQPLATQEVPRKHPVVVPLAIDASIAPVDLAVSREAKECARLARKRRMAIVKQKKRENRIIYKVSNRPKSQMFEQRSTNAKSMPRSGGKFYPKQFYFTAAHI
jgi:hypothetical protein